MKTLNFIKTAGFTAILFVLMSLTTSNLLACTPGFTWSQTANLTISFTDTTSGLDANRHFYWYFGDSHSDTSANPVHVYATAGAYYVCLHVIDSTISCNTYYCDSIHVTGINCGAFTASLIAANTTCHVCTDGWAAVNITGGHAPYTFSWSPSGGTNQTATGLAAGIYTCCVTDSNGCTACASRTVYDTVICNMTMAGYQMHWASCSNCSDGEAHAYITGGTSPYSYQWTPSNETTQYATGLTPGVYTCCATDINGCTACTAVTIHDSFVCNVSIGAYQYQWATCSTCNDGVGHSYASGGTAPYTYMWTPSGQTTQIATGLTAGVYTVCAHDANNCYACTTVVIHDSSSCNITLYAYEYLSASCSTCANGVAHAFATGGNAPYSYSWSPSGDTTNIVTNLTPGNYTVCVTDAHGCTACHTVTIGDSTYNCNLTVGAYQYHESSCYSCPNGIAHAYASGGTAPYTYSWSPSGGTNAFAYSLTPGIYTVCVTDAHNCSACTTVSIGDSINSTGCSAYFYLYADTAHAHNYFAINYVTGTAPFTFLWSWGDNTYDSIALPSHTYANPGVYTICLHITDATGCTSTYCRSDSLARTEDLMVYINVIAPETSANVPTIVSPSLIWTLYPNPANNMITLHQSIKSNSQLIITDISGREIYNQNSTEIDNSIDVSKWSEGVYFYEIINNNNISRSKFVILK
jgi:PKD repeat protein